MLRFSDCSVCHFSIVGVWTLEVALLLMDKFDGRRGGTNIVLVEGKKKRKQVGMIGKRPWPISTSGEHTVLRCCSSG